MAREKLSISNGGWVLYESGRLQAWLRLEREGERLRAVELYVPPGLPLAGAMDRLKPSRIEAWANDPDVRDHILARIDLAGPADLSRWVRALSQEMETSRKTYSPRLPRHRGPKYPDTFYRHVAGVYSALVSMGKRPAPEIAQANGVPVSTVHRWVREARRRGFLPPGERGRAG